MFKKTDKQQEACEAISSSREILCTGGSGSGKSVIAIYALFYRALKASGTTHIIVRRYSNSIRRSIWMQTIPDILKLCFPDLKPLCHLDNTQMVVRLPNESVIMCMGFDNQQQMDKVLGINCSTIFIDEITELSQDQMAVLKGRLREKSNLTNKLIACCNPTTKTSWIYKHFVEAGKFVKMNPESNLENLGEGYLETLASLPPMQRKRFLEGEWVAEIEGALFSVQNIETNRKQAETHDRIVIGIDPAVTTKINSDLTGVIVCSKTDNDYYVLEDASAKYTPKQLSTKISQLWRKYDADKCVVETNQGGDYVIDNLEQHDPDIYVEGVHHRKSKIVRAEKISYLYEKNLVHHQDVFPDLEAEMTSYTIDTKESPDRLDALVIAIRELKEDYIDMNFGPDKWEDRKKRSEERMWKETV